MFTGVPSHLLASLSVCLPVCLSVSRLSVCLCVCLSVCLSVYRIHLGVSGKVDSLHALPSGALPVVHTLTRVEMPIPTQRHPLAGIWRSTGMHAHTCIMDVRYDFTSRAATIAATQVIITFFIIAL